MRSGVASVEEPIPRRQHLSVPRWSDGCMASHEHAGEVPLWVLPMSIHGSPEIWSGRRVASPRIAAGRALRSYGAGGEEFPHSAG